MAETGELYAQAQRYLVRQDASLWSCMDDRSPADDDTLLRGRLYSQIPGGVEGLAQDLATTMEVQEPGSFTDKNVEVHEFGKVIHDLASRQGIRLLMHEACAAFMNNQAVAETVMQPDQKILKHSNELMPGIADSRYTAITSSVGKIASSGLFAPQEVADFELRSEGDGRARVPFAKLQGQHVARGFLPIHDTSIVLDVGKAVEEGNGVYCITFGNMEQLHDAINPLIPFDLDIFRQAAAIRTAVIGRHYLLGPDNQPLPILTEQKAA